jgi:type VI secretion system secreted protein Hcp
MAASDFILEIAEIPGESQDHAFKDKGIDILSWSWGVSNAGSAAAQGGMGAGKASFSDISLMKVVDKSSPKIAWAVATGKHYPEAKLHIRKQGDGAQEYILITLTDFIVSSYQPSAGGGPDVMESFSLNYSKVKFEYKPQDGKGGLGAAIPFTYDLKAGKAV